MRNLQREEDPVAEDEVDRDEPVMDGSDEDFSDWEDLEEAEGIIIILTDK